MRLGPAPQPHLNNYSDSGFDRQGREQTRRLRAASPGLRSLPRRRYIYTARAMTLWGAGKSLFYGVLLSGHFAGAVDLVIDDPSSIKSAALIVAKGMLNYYSGDEPGGTPGLLPQPYYWWEAGAMFGTLIDYWYYTGDDQFNAITSAAMQFQTGPDSNFMPPNQTSSLGNDDQGFWSLAAMSAAEVKFPNPPSDKPQWLALAQGVFNSQAGRWDLSTCGGGLKWQIYSFNSGWNYKNSISNGIFFNLGARLGAYTQNQTYLDWAEKTWDWSEAIGLLNDTGGTGTAVYDGSADNINCSDVNHQRWSYNSGVYLLGAAVMWNQVSDFLQLSHAKLTERSSDKWHRAANMGNSCSWSGCWHQLLLQEQHHGRRLRGHRSM
nr:mannan endo-1,6-alpha-mannosidase dcw1 [Quercus suber]